MAELTFKINNGIEEKELDAIAAVGVDNFTYLSGIVLPFAHNYLDRQAVIIWTREGQRSVICPLDWAEAIRDQGWDGQLHVCDEIEYVPFIAAAESLAEALSELGLKKGRVGLDYSRGSQSLFDMLITDLPDIDWVPCDGLLEDLRITKTGAEIELLEVAAKQTQRGILGTSNHLEGTLESPGGIGYSIAEISERVRVHMSEYSASHVGHLATMRGPDAAIYYAPQTVTEVVCQGDLVRIDATYHFRGYWSNAGRMMVIGEPTEEQEKSYEDNLVLKAAAVEKLGPGVPCHEVFQEVERVADRNGIRFSKEVGIGHGVGTSPREPPYLDRASTRELENGMVVVLDIHTYGPREELIHSKETYEIVDSGSRLMGRYRNWDKLHAVKGVQAVVID